MLEMLRLAVTGAKRNDRHVGICGEAPANYPEIARYCDPARHQLDQRQSVSVLRTMAIVRQAEIEVGDVQAPQSRSQ